MEILKDKKFLIGVAVLALAGYWYWKKNQVVPVVEEVAPPVTTPPASTPPVVSVENAILDDIPEEFHPLIKPRLTPNYMGHGVYGGE
jgi:hypothetical protein